MDYPVGGEWSLLYSSAANGFSLNRFLHHCSDYRGPSVMLLCYRDDESVEHLLALAVDVEWRCACVVCVCVRVCVRACVHACVRVCVCEAA